jgi:hypothetical protein
LVHEFPERCSAKYLVTMCRAFAVSPVFRHCLRQTRCVCAGSEATKQSSLAFKAGLLRCARNDAARRIRGRPSITHFVIARSEATKQSSFVVRKLDCFAALAMTRVGLFRKSPVQPNPKKYLASSPRQNTCLIAPSRPTKGRSRSSRTRGGMRWTLL